LYIAGQSVTLSSRRFADYPATPLLTTSLLLATNILLPISARATSADSTFFLSAHQRCLV